MQGTTDQDGRIGNLLPPADRVAPGVYRMSFDTATYMATSSAVTHRQAFYPRVHVHFQIDPTEVRTGACTHAPHSGAFLHFAAALVVCNLVWLGVCRIQSKM